MSKFLKIKKVLMMILVLLGATMAFCVATTIKEKSALSSNKNQEIEREELINAGLTDGDGDGYYDVYSASDLIAMRDAVNDGSGNSAKYKLMANLNLIDYQLGSAGNVSGYIKDLWEPIGTYTNPFMGEFDGNGYSITMTQLGAYITTSNTASYSPKEEIKKGGLLQIYQKDEVHYIGDSPSNAYFYGLFGFGRAYNKTIIKNLFLEIQGMSIAFEDVNAVANVGGLIGAVSSINVDTKNANYTIGFPAIANCYVKVTGPKNGAGMVIGYPSDANVQLNYYEKNGSAVNSVNTGAQKSLVFGFIAGFSECVRIDSCVARFVQTTDWWTQECVVVNKIQAVLWFFNSTYANERTIRLNVSNRAWIGGISGWGDCCIFSSCLFMGGNGENLVTMSVNNTGNTDKVRMGQVFGGPFAGGEGKNIWDGNVMPMCFSCIVAGFSTSSKFNSEHNDRANGVIIETNLSSVKNIDWDDGFDYTGNNLWKGYEEGDFYSYFTKPKVIDGTTDSSGNSYYRINYTKMGQKLFNESSDTFIDFKSESAAIVKCEELAEKDLNSFTSRKQLTLDGTDGINYSNTSSWPNWFLCQYTEDGTTKDLAFEGLPIQSCFVKIQNVAVYELFPGFVSGSGTTTPTARKNFPFVSGMSVGVWIKNNLSTEIANQYGYKFLYLTCGIDDTEVKYTKDSSTRIYLTGDDNKDNFTANWSAQSYKLTFYINEDDTTAFKTISGSGNYGYGGSNKVEIPASKIPGQQLVEWKCVNANYNSIEYSPKGIQMGDTLQVGNVLWGELVFVAVLEDLPLTIVIHDASGKVLSTTAVTDAMWHANGAVAFLPSSNLCSTLGVDVPTKTGYKLVGWNDVLDTNYWMGRVNSASEGTIKLTGVTNSGSYKVSVLVSRNSDVARNVISGIYQSSTINGENVNSSGTIDLYPVFAPITYNIYYLDPTAGSSSGDTTYYYSDHILNDDTASELNLPTSYKYGSQFKLTTSSYITYNGTRYGYFGIYGGGFKNGLAVYGTVTYGFYVNDSLDLPLAVSNTIKPTSPGNIYILLSQNRTNSNTFTLNFYIPDSSYEFTLDDSFPTLKYQCADSVSVEAGKGLSNIYNYTTDDWYQRPYYITESPAYWTTIPITSMENAVNASGQTWYVTIGAAGDSVDLYLSLKGWTEYTIYYKDKYGNKINGSDGSPLTATYTILDMLPITSDNLNVGGDYDDVYISYYTNADAVANKFISISASDISNHFGTTSSKTPNFTIKPSSGSISNLLDTGVEISTHRYIIYDTYYYTYYVWNNAYRNNSGVVEGEYSALGIYNDGREEGYAIDTNIEALMGVYGDLDVIVNNDDQEYKITLDLSDMSDGGLIANLNSKLINNGLSCTASGNTIVITYKASDVEGEPYTFDFAWLEGYKYLGYSLTLLSWDAMPNSMCVKNMSFTNPCGGYTCEYSSSLGMFVGEGVGGVYGIAGLGSMTITLGFTGEDYQVRYYYKIGSAYNLLSLTTDLQETYGIYTRGSELVLPIKDVIEGLINTNIFELDGFEENGWQIATHNGNYTYGYDSTKPMTKLSGGTYSSSTSGFIDLYVDIKYVEYSAIMYYFKDFGGNVDTENWYYKGTYNYSTSFVASGSGAIYDINGLLTSTTMQDLLNDIMQDYTSNDNIYKLYSGNAVLLGWASDDYDVFNYENGLITGFAKSPLKDITLYPVIGQAIKFVDANENDITSSIVNQGFIDGNYLYKIGDNYYYNINNSLPIKKGVWNAYSVSTEFETSSPISIIANGAEYNLFKSNTTYDKNNGDLSGYFANGVTFTSVDTITYYYDPSDTSKKSTPTIYSKTSNIELLTYNSDTQQFSDGYSLIKNGYTFKGWKIKSLAGVSIEYIGLDSFDDYGEYIKKDESENIIYTLNLDLENYNYLFIRLENGCGYARFNITMDDNNNNWITTLMSGAYGNIEIEAYWEPITYTITFEDYGSTESIEYTIEDTITLPEGVPSSHYKFLYWKVKSGTNDGNWNSTQYNANSDLRGMYGNVTLQICQEAEPYTITYKNIDGAIDLDGDVSRLETYAYNAGDVTIHNRFEKTGYTFKGFTVEGETTSSTSSPATFTDTDSSVSHSLSYTYKVSYYGLTVYKFSSLNNGSHGNITLCAIWEPITYNISYYINDTQEITDIQTTTYTIEDSVDLPATFIYNGTNYSNAQWKFMGYIDTDGTDSANGSGWGDIGNTIASVEAGSYGNVKLQWVEQTITVTANANGGTFGTIGTISNGWTVTSETTATKDFVYGTAIDVLPACGWLHHTLDGWYDAQTGGNPITTDKIITNGIVIYAHWTTNTYTLTLYANGGTINTSTNWTGSGTSATKTITYDGELGIMPNEDDGTISRTGYTFVGWYVTDEEGKTLTTEYNGSTDGSVTEVYANWTPINYTLTLNSLKIEEVAWPTGWTTSTESSTGYQIATKGFDCDAKYYSQLPTQNEISCTGYTFIGWYTDEDCIINVSSTATMPASKLTLYAKWEINSYTLTLNANGGTISSSANWTGNGASVTKELNYNAPYGTLPTQNEILYAGKTFGGWFTDTNYTTEVTSTKTMGAEDTTIYAKWVDSTITYEIWKENTTGSEKLYTLGPSTYSGSTTISSTETIFENSNLADYYLKGCTIDADWKISTLGNPNNWGSIGDTITNGTSCSGKYGSITLRTYLTAKEYIITFVDDDGATKLYDDVMYAIDSTYTLPTPTKGGASFSAWEVVSCDATNNWKDGLPIAVGDTINGGTSVSLKYGSLNLKAVWTYGGYNITYKDNGKELTGCTPTSYQADFSTAINLPSLEKDGYTFNGWTIDTSITPTYNGTTATYTGSDFKYIVTVKESGSRLCTHLLPGSYGNIIFNANWTEIKYTLTLTNTYATAINGYTKVGDNFTLEYTISTSITLPSLSRAGYTFNNFKSTVNSGSWTSGTYSAGSYTNCYGNITLEAQWGEETYYITYTGEGINNQADTYTITTGNVLKTNTEVSRIGYTLQGWEVDSEVFNNYNTTDLQVTYAGTDYNHILNATEDDGKYICTNLLAGSYGNITLKAIWTINNYTLTLDAKGGTISESVNWDGSGTSVTKKLNYNAPYGILPTESEITFAGYTFDGWYSDEGCSTGNEVNSETIIGAENATIYAKWTTNKYKVTLNSQTQGSITWSGGSGWTISGDKSFATKNFDYGAIYSSNLPNLSLAGYQFNGWYDAKTDGNKVDENSNLVMPDSNVELYAQWNAVNYSINYYIDDTTKITLAPSEYSIETNGQNLPGEFTYSGTTYTNVIWIFKGYTTNDGTGTGDGYGWTQDAVITTINAGMYGHVRLQLKPYTITYGNVGDATLDGADGTTSYYPTTSITLPTYKKTGYTFNGWKYVSGINATKWDSAVTYNGNIGSGFGGDVTLNAIWGINEYTLTLNANGGTIKSSANWTGSGISVTKTLEYKASYGILPDVSKITRNGYTFVGWFSADGTPVDENTTMEAENVTIHAEWNYATFNINYYKEDGADTYTLDELPTGTEFEYTYQESDSSRNITLPDLEETGRTFLGWLIKFKTSDSYYITIDEANSIVTYTETYKDGDVTKAIECKLIYTTKDGTKYYTSLNTNSYGDIDFIATWKNNTYTITFDKGNDSATGSMPTQTYTFNAQDTLNPNLFKLGGKDFAGWKVVSTTGNWELNKIIANNYVIEEGLYGDVTLQAQWEDTSAMSNITYYREDGTTQITGLALTKYGVSHSYTLPTQSEVKVDFASGYEFAGWVLKGDNAGTYTFSYDDSNTYIIGINEQSYGDIELQAVVTPIRYTINYYNNETGMGSSNYTTITDYEVKPDDENYAGNGKIVGWMVKVDNATTTTDSDAQTIEYTTDGGHYKLHYIEITDDKYICDRILTGSYGDVNLIAYWKEYNITYQDADGNTLQQNIYNCGEGWDLISTHTNIDGDITIWNLVSVKDENDVDIENSGWKLTYTYDTTTKTGFTIDANTVYGNVVLKTDKTAEGYTVVLIKEQADAYDSSYNNGQEWSETYNTYTELDINQFVQQVKNYNPDTSGFTLSKIGYSTSNFIGWYIDIENYNVEESVDCIIVTSKTDASVNIKFAYTNTSGKWLVTKILSGSKGNITLLEDWGTPIDYSIEYYITYNVSGKEKTEQVDKNVLGVSLAPTTYNVTTDNESLPTNQTLKYGYTASGAWTVKENLNTWSVDEEYTSIAQGSWGDVKLYVSLDIISYTINLYGIEQNDEFSKTVDINRSWIEGVDAESNNIYSTEYNVNLETTLPTLERAGFTFKGWKILGQEGSFVTATSTIIITDGSVSTYIFELNDDRYAIKLLQDSFGDLNLEAVYEVNNYNISYKKLYLDLYDINTDMAEYTEELDIEGNIEGLALTYTIRDTITLPSKDDISAYVDTGYYFEGKFAVLDVTGNWGIFNLNDENTMYANSFSGQYGDVTLYAIFNLTEYTITYKDTILENGETKEVELDKATYNYKTEMALKLDCTKNGYSFIGWIVVGDNFTVSNIDIIKSEITYTANGIQINAKLATSLTIDGKYAINQILLESYGDITLKAVWQTNTYTITYQTASNTVLQTQDYTIDKAFTLISENIAQWQLIEADNDSWGELLTTIFDAGQQLNSTFNMFGNVTLRAYGNNTYKITLDLNGGNIKSDVVAPNGNVYYDGSNYYIIYGLDQVVEVYNYLANYVYKNGYGYVTKFVDESGEECNVIPANYCQDITLTAQYPTTAIEYTLNYYLRLLDVDGNVKADENLNMQYTFTIEDANYMLPMQTKNGFTHLSKDIQVGDITLGYLYSIVPEGSFVDSEITYIASGSYLDIDNATKSINIYALLQANIYTITYFVPDNTGANVEYSTKVEWNVYSEDIDLLSYDELIDIYGSKLITWKLDENWEQDAGALGEYLIYTNSETLAQLKFTTSPTTIDGEEGSALSRLICQDSYSNIELYGVWEDIKYTISYYASAEDVEIEKPLGDKIYTYYDTIRLATTEFIGYNVTSWTVQEVSNENSWITPISNWIQNNAYLTTNSYINMYGNVKLVMNDTTLNIYTLTLNLDGATCNSGCKYKQNVVDDKIIITFSTNEINILDDINPYLNKLGYKELVGWYATEETNNALANCSINKNVTYTVAGDDNIYFASVLCDTDVTLNAVWVRCEYPIEFYTYKLSTDEKGTTPIVFTDEDGDISYKFNIEESLELPTYIPEEGYKFKGWAVLDSYGNFITFDKTNASTIFTTIPAGKYGDMISGAEKTLTLYAILESKEYSITYYDNENAVILNLKAQVTTNGIISESNIFTVESSIILPTNVSILGRTFKGWTLRSCEGNANIIENNGYVTGFDIGTYGNIELQGEFEYIKYEITYAKYYPTASKLEDVTPQVGYYTIKDGLVDSDGNLVSLPSELITINANADNGFEYTGKWAVYEELEDSNWQNFAKDITNIDDIIAISESDFVGKYGNIIVVQIMTHKEYEITYVDADNQELGKAKYSVISPILYNDDGEEVENLYNYSLIGYTFNGWELEDYDLDEARKLNAYSGLTDDEILTQFKNNFNKNGAGYLVSYILEVNKSNTDTTKGLSVGNFTLKANISTIDYKIVYISKCDDNKFTSVSSEIVLGEQSYNIEQNINLLSAIEGYGNIYEWKLYAYFDSNKNYIFDGDDYDLTKGNWEDVLNTSTTYTGHYGNVVIYTDIKPSNYIISLNVDDGTISNYNVRSSGATFNAENNTIAYNVTSTEFALPTATQIVKEGYTFRGWKVEGDADYIDAIYPNESTIKYILTLNNIDNYYYITSIDGASTGNSVLKAIWEENVYTIVLNSNDGKADKIETQVAYTEIFNLTNSFTRSGYKFVGWTVEEIDVPTYAYINTWLNLDFVTEESALNGAERIWSYEILIDNSFVTKLSTGYDTKNIPVDANKINVYALWTQIYTVTINANGGEIYKDGVKQSTTSYTAKNDYFEGFSLPTITQNDMFTSPNNGLYWEKHYIDGWYVSVGTTRYKVSGEVIDNIPSIDQWVVISGSETATVNNGINLQYLQGNIVVSPVWKVLVFDVRFRTDGVESYKQNYKNIVTVTEAVQYGSQYILSAESNTSLSAKHIKVTNISGYSIIYANPYNNSTIDNSHVISVYGVWDYDLDYKQYTSSDNFEKDSGWYVEIEGYYSPNLYRVKLDLNLPYTTSVEVNSGSFVTTSATMDDVADKYTSLDATNNYIESAEYTSMQNKLFYVAETEEYYIYLLQGQKIGREESANTIVLPTFAIPYYEMQYYQTTNNINEIYAYKVVDNAKMEINANEVTDWKYSYCNTNEDTSKFVLNVVWYRNEIYVQINNLLGNNNTSAGYVLVDEQEQLIGSLTNHNRYHLVIYAYDNIINQYSYITYSFNTLLGIDAKTILNYSLTELSSNNIIKSNDNQFNVYAGNLLVITAYDQSKDSSMDNFIGYRFNQYNSQVVSSTCVNVDVTSQDVFSQKDMKLSLDLQEYSEDINSSNYLADKDTIIINAEFDTIKYSMQYYIGDSSSTDAKPQYGTIKVVYGSQNINESAFTLENITINDINAIISKAMINLGYDFTCWKLGDAEFSTSREFELIINAEFLRNNVYLDGKYSNAQNQIIGKAMKAECTTIDFTVKVNVRDLSKSQDAIIYSYELNDSAKNILFNIQNDNSQLVYIVNIGNVYTLKMLEANTGDDYVYYYLDGKAYAIQDLYLGYKDVLYNTFNFPSASYADITMDVNNDLLSKVISYSDGSPVVEKNRVLQFYVEVLPLLDVEFTITNGQDINKELRKISANNIIVAIGADENNLVVTEEGNKFKGFMTQQIIFKFEANSNYYKQAKLTINDSDVQYVLVNQTCSYTLTSNSIINIELELKGYNLNAEIVYNGNTYDLSKDPEIYKTITNPSGTNIFDTIDGIVISNTNNRLDNYYTGDIVKLNYTLNSNLASDYIVTVRANGLTMEFDEDYNAYITEFTNKDITIVINIEVKTSNVILRINRTDDIGEVLAQINNGSMQYIASSNNSNTINDKFKLQAGDVINVYIKTNLFYKFNGTYSYIDRYNANVVQVQEGVYAGYIKFTLFDKNDANGIGEYISSKAGQYVLNFDEVEIGIEFKYYVGDMEDSRSQSGSGYSYLLDTADIKPNTTITIVKGVDNAGFRFDGYTYNANKTDSASKELNSQFVVDDEIINYLNGVEIVNNKLIFAIYVNYVRQYKFEVTTEGIVEQIKYFVEDKDGVILTAGKYYDSGTLININALSVDTSETSPYVISGTINNYTCDKYYVDGYITNNKGSMIGFNKYIYLLSDTSINLVLSSEKYNISFIENNYNSLEEIENGTPEQYNKTLSSTDSIPEMFASNFDGVYYKVSTTYEYGTSVVITIMVERPNTDVEKENWRQLQSIVINGAEITLPQPLEVLYGGSVLCDAYTVEYQITNDSSVEINFINSYYVEVE